MDRLLAMQAFVRVVESGTFVKAADSLHLPKPTVTRLIQGLEAHLRTQLLHRTTRRVTVTPDGAAYYDRALRVLGDIDELESGMSRANANPHGRLRIGVGSAVGLQLLIPALPDFVVRYPQIQVDLAVGDRPVDLSATPAIRNVGSRPRSLSTTEDTENTEGIQIPVFLCVLCVLSG